MPSLIKTINFSSFAGSYGSANQAVHLTLDQANDVMSMSNVPIVIPSGSVTGLAPSATVDTTNASNITSGTLDQVRLPATTVAPGTYGSSNAIPVVVVDATGRLTLASNITTWTTTDFALAYTGSVGIGTLSPTSALQVVGVTTLDTVSVSNILSTNTLGPASGSTISLSGASLTNIGDITVSGQLTLPQSIHSPVQVQGVSQTFLVADESVTTFTLPPIAGYFEGTASDMDVYMNGKKLAYQNEGVKDYDIARQFNPVTSNTVYSMTLVYQPHAGDVLDVHMVPTIPAAGYFYQQVAVCNMSPWDFRATDNSIYFTAGSVGVGTTAPSAALDVVGSLSVSGAATIGGQALGAAAFTPGNNASLLTTGTLSSNILPASGVVAGSYGSATQIPFLKVDASGRITQTSNVALASITANTNASVLTSGTLSSNLLPASGVAAASYGDATHVPAITIDVSGRITAASAVAITSSQWTTNGSAIGYSIGSVGIGTTAPTAALTVAGDVAVAGALHLGGNTITNDAQNRINVPNLLASNITAASNLFVYGTQINIGGANSTINIAGVVSSGTINSNALPITGIAAAGYGDATHIPFITVDDKGRVIGASNVAIQSSQWVNSVSGADISFVAGNVGIGTTVSDVLMNVYAPPPQVRIHPPVAFNMGTNTVTGQAFGNGTYILTSSGYNGDFGAGHDANVAISGGDTWVTRATYAYQPATSPIWASSSAASTDGYLGEYAQLQFPSPFLLSSITVDGVGSFGPSHMRIYASNDGATWVLIQSISDQYGWSLFSDNRNFATPANVGAFTYIRFVVGAVAGAGDAQIKYLAFYGYLYGDGSPVFTVASTTVTNTGFVGIGTAAPQHQLDVYGSAQLTNGGLKITNSMGTIVFGGH